jgi:hypothetical protein
VKRKLSFLAIGCVWLFLSVPAPAQDLYTITRCPGKTDLPVVVRVDCSNVADPATKRLCLPFAENQACKVFFAYREITGIELEKSCPVIKYRIFDKDKWPHTGGEGGLAGKCGVDYLAEYSVQTKSDLGPYDVHEILHLYQQQLGALPYMHILFGPSMAEARRLIKDDKGYKASVERMKYEMKRISNDFRKRAIPPARQCLSAELFIEESLYLKDPGNVEQFYRRLQRGREMDITDRQARFNRMYDEVSGGMARQYLLSHGCEPF